MKQLIAIAALAVISATCQAQTASTPALDTVVDATIDTLYAPDNYFKGNDGVFSVAFQATKVTGTAALTVVFEGNVNGLSTGWKGITETSADTFTVTNTAGAQLKNLYYTGKKLYGFRARCIGAGTQTTAVRMAFIKK